MKEPSAGPEIMDLLTLPFLPVFFFVGDEAALAEENVNHLVHFNAVGSHTFLCFPAVHFLVECLRLSLLSEDNAYHAILYSSDCQSGDRTQRRNTHIPTERMEERPILIIFEILIQLMFPDNPSGPRKIHHLQCKETILLIMHKCESALKSSIRPFVRLRMGKVYAS